MMFFIYRYRIKAAIRDRQMLFWTFLFPLILSTLFGMAFTNLSKNEVFQIIPIAVVNNENYQSDPYLRQALLSVSGESGSTAETPLFDLKECSQEQAEAALSEESIVGYLLLDQSLTVVVNDSGIRQTILKIFADDYLQKRATMEQILKDDPNAWPRLAAQLSSTITVLSDEPIGSAKADTVMAYYYALIAMTCLYGGFWGLKEVITIQANLSPQATRLNVAPVPKMKLFAVSLSAALTVHYLSVLVLLFYLHFVIGAGFGDQIGYVLAAAFTASLLGVSIGGFVAASTKLNESVKNAVFVCFSMVCSFFSGLMIVNIKYITTKACPALSFLNPANLISDAFYALYYYDTPYRTISNMGLQLAFSALLFGVIALIVRRQRYASL